MSDDGPRRLLDYGDDLNGLLRSALNAERDEALDERRLERIAQALVAAPVATAPEPSWFAAKGPFVVLAAVAVGGLAFIRSSEPPPVTTPVLEPTVEQVSPAPPSIPIPTISPADLPSAPAKPLPAPVAPKPAAQVDELGLIARAHDALRGNPGQSLALCKEHETKFASGQFAEEREAVAIEALVYLERKNEADRRWTAFQKRFPSSSHRAHLEGFFSP